MNKIIHATSVALLASTVSACLSSGGTTTEQASILVSELTSVCSSIVGEQAAQRINQEWAKYPEAEVNRDVIENVAGVLLNNPGATEQQRTSQYKQYMTCATGLLVANGAVK